MHFVRFSHCHRDVCVVVAGRRLDRKVMIGRVSGVSAFEMWMDNSAGG